MPRKYSMDLRIKAIEAMERGLPLLRVCKTFGVGRTTLYGWRRKWRKTSSVEDKQIKRPPGAVRDIEKFEEFVRSKPDRTTAEMANEWGNISSTTIRKTLKRLGFTYKKNFWIQRKRR